MRLLDRAQILNGFSIKKESVILQLGEGEETGVYVKELTAGEHNKYIKSITDISGKVDTMANTATAKLIQLCCVDENGKNIFEVTDLEAINSLPLSITRTLQDAISKLNFSAEDEEKN